MKHPFLHNLYAFAILLFLFMTGCRDHSPVATKLQQAETCMYESPDSALRLLESIPHPERLTGQAQADYALLMTQARSRCRITATSDSLIQVAVRYYQPSHDNARKAHSYLYLADVYMDMKKYTEAITPLKKAEEMLEDAAPYIQSLTYSKLGYLNRRSGNNQMAFGYYQKAKAINLSMNHQEWYISNLVNILNLPLQEVRDSVTVYIEELEEVLFTARPDLQAKAYNNIGIYYHDKERWGLAEQYYRKAIGISPSAPYRSYLNLARIYDAQGHPERADSLYQKALHSPVWATRAVIYKDLYSRSLAAGRHQEAIGYMNRYQAAADSFHTQQKSKEVMEIQLKYEHEVTARQKAETEARLYLFIIGTIVVFLLLAFVGYQCYLYIKGKQDEYLQKIQMQINKIQELDENGIRLAKEQEDLNHLLKESRILNEKFLKAKGEWTSIKDIHALGLYIRLRKDPTHYNPDTDHQALSHWLDIAANGFAEKFSAKHPILNQSESALCYLRKAGFSYPQIATMLHVKAESINRYIYRTCEDLSLSKSKTAFEEYINSF